MRLLFVLSFAETALLPVPVEVVMVPYMLKHPRRIWIAAAVVSVGCLLASLLGYVVGLLLYDSLGQWLLAVFGYEDALGGFREAFRRHGFAAIAVIGATPIPYHVAMLVAGAMHYPVLLYLAAAFVGRCGRYFVIAGMVRVAGDQALHLWKRHRPWAVLLLVAGLIVFSIVTVPVGNEVAEELKNA